MVSFFLGALAINDVSNISALKQTEHNTLDRQIPDFIHLFFKSSYNKFRGEFLFLFKVEMNVGRGETRAAEWRRWLCGWWCFLIAGLQLMKYTEKLVFFST